MPRLKKDTERIKICGIYKITNPNGKIYIGQSIDIGRRKERYRNASCKGQTKILRSILKYGFERHSFEIIEECLRESLNDREVYWGLYYNSISEDHLNLVLGNGKTIISDETLKRMSESHLGKKHSPEQKEKFNRGAVERGKKISIGKTGKKIKPFTDEHKRLLKESNLNKQPMKTIIQYDKDGNFIKEWIGLIRTAETLGVKKTDLCAAIYNKAGRKTLLGYIWKYKIT